MAVDSEIGAYGARRYLAGIMAGRTAAFLRRLLRNPITLAGVVILLAMIVVSIGAPLFSPFDPTELHLKERVQGPSSRYLLGTDEAGRDLLSNLLHAGRISLSAAVAAEALALLLGAPLGLIAGFWRGKLDDVIMRFMDGLLAFPGVLLALTIVGLFGTSVKNMVLAIGITFTRYFPDGIQCFHKRTMLG